MAYQNTLPDHSWIKLYVNIQVDWSGGQLNRLWGEIRKWSISFVCLQHFFCLSHVLFRSDEFIHVLLRELQLFLLRWCDCDAGFCQLYNAIEPKHCLLWKVCNDKRNEDFRSGCDEGTLLGPWWCWITEGVWMITMSTATGPSVTQAQVLGLKRLSIFAYWLTVNTNDRFIGLTIIDSTSTVIRDTGPVAFANSKQRLSTAVISCHSWTSLQHIWWYDRSWLTFPSVCLIKDLACSNHVGCFITGYGGKFRKLLPGPGARRQLKSFRYTRETAAKFSAVRLPLKQRISTARSFSIQKVSCVCVPRNRLGRTQSWTIVVKRHTISRLRSQETLHFLRSLARWRRLIRREASCVQDGTLYSSSRRESSRTKAGTATTEDGAGCLDRSTTTLLRRRAEAPSRHPRAAWTLAIAAAK